jgi:hypothetical protein
MPANEAPHLFLLSIPIHVAIPECLVGQLAGDAYQLTLQGVSLTIGGNERFPQPRVLALPVVGLRLFSFEEVEHR